MVLNLSKLANKHGLGFLLSGLKSNRKVEQLALADCGLDDEDLEKLCSKLLEEESVTTLKIAQNHFSQL